MDRDGRIPLHYATLADDAPTVATLLSRGADPNAANWLGFTPLHLAAQEGAISAAEMLLAAGADV